MHNKLFSTYPFTHHFRLSKRKNIDWIFSLFFISRIPNFSISFVWFMFTSCIYLYAYFHRYFFAWKFQAQKYINVFFIHYSPHQHDHNNIVPRSGRREPEWVFIEFPEFFSKWFPLCQKGWHQNLFQNKVGVVAYDNQGDVFNWLWKRRIFSLLSCVCCLLCSFLWELISQYVSCSSFIYNIFLPLSPFPILVVPCVSS